MKFLRKISFPFAAIYWLVIVLRNKLYDIKVFKSYKFDIPVISVGNIAVGGTGKSPMVEYLIRLLKDDYKVSTLSRGFGRKSKGYIEASALSSPQEIGDEPTQFKQKFNEVMVTVCEDRATALKNLQNRYDVVLMDDAYQHRKVRVGISILLFDYNKVFEKDWMLPFGNMREPISGMKRADIVLVTKTPKIFSPMERRRVELKLNINAQQKIAYSYLSYSEMKPLSERNLSIINKMEEVNKKTQVVLVTGIANPSLLVNYLESLKWKNIIHLNYPDHHRFSLKDIEKIKNTYAQIASENKLLLTTEKDAMRLKHPSLERALEELPFYFLPIEAHLHDKDKEQFDQLIIEYVKSGRKHN